MKLKITNPALPIGEIGITRAFSEHLPRTDKLIKCLEFYRQNKRFDRQIIVDGENYLHDGYCAYLVARMVGMEEIKVLKVSERKEAVTGGTTPIVKKHVYKVGDMVRIIGNSNFHQFANGEIVRLVWYAGSEYRNWDAKRLDGSGSWYVRESDIEPYTETTAQDPIKLYCVKSHEPGTWCTAGRVYEIDQSGCITHDDGFREADFIRCMKNGRTISGFGTEWSKYLVPLVKRPAKVGEWVYMVNNMHGDLLPGTIHKCIGYGVFGRGYQCSNSYNYLVLDGYKGGDSQ